MRWHYAVVCALVVTACSLVEREQVNAYQDITITGEGFPYNGNGAAISGKVLSFGVAADSFASSAYLSITGKLAESSASEPYSAEWELYAPSGGALPAFAYQGGILPNKVNANASEPLFAATLAPDAQAGVYRVELRFLVQGQPTETTLSRSFRVLARPELSDGAKIDAAFVCNSGTEQVVGEQATRTSAEAVDPASSPATVAVKLATSLCPGGTKTFSLGRFHLQGLPAWVVGADYDLPDSDAVSLKPYYQLGDSMEAIVLSTQQLEFARKADAEGEATLGGLLLTRGVAPGPDANARLRLRDVYGQQVELDVVVHMGP